MSILNEENRQTIITDYEVSKKRDKVRHFLSIGGAVGFCLALTGALGCLSVAIIQDSDINHQRLKEIAQTPLIYDAGQINGCHLSYINTAHPVSAKSYEEDILLKYDCNGSISVTPITNTREKRKRKIDFSKMKLLNEQTSAVKKPKM